PQQPLGPPRRRGGTPAGGAGTAGLRAAVEGGAGGLLRDYSRRQQPNPGWQAGTQQPSRAQGQEGHGTASGAGVDGCVTARPWYLCGGETLVQQIAHAAKGKARRFRKKFRKRQEGKPWQVSEIRHLRPPRCSVLNTCPEV